MSATPTPERDRRGLSRFRILEPLAIRDFALLYVGVSISLLGDGVYFVAIAWQVYELSNAPTALSIVGLAWSVPMVIFLLGGGVLSDRFDRRLLLIVSDVIRAVAIGILGVLSLTGELELWHVVVLVAVAGTGDSLFGPAFGAIVPDIVPQHLLVQANSLNQFVEPLGIRLIGPALGGLAIATFGLGEAILIDAGSFVVSAIAIALMRTRTTVEREPVSVRQDVIEGLRFVRERVWLWGTLVSAAFGLLLFIGPYEVLVPYVVKNELGGGADDLGFVFAAGGVGAVIAAVLVGQYGLPRRHMVFMYGTWSVSYFAVAGYGVATELWHAMVASFVGGAGFSAGLVVWATLMQRLVPTGLLGRVSSLDWFVSISLIPVSFALTGPIAEAVGTTATLLGAGLLGVPATILFLFLPGMRDSERDGSIHPSAEAPVGEARPPAWGISKANE